MLIHGILNAQLSAALAGLRHKDVFVVSDCGLPVPQGIEVIDLAVVFGVPRFEEVLERWVKDHFNVPLSYVPHDGSGGFKSHIKNAKFVVRTGETTSYANVIFRCGVPF